MSPFDSFLVHNVLGEQPASPLNLKNATGSGLLDPFVIKGDSNMCEYGNQKDIDHFYAAVGDLVDSLAEISPDTAATFKSQIESRDKSPFEILRKMTRRLIISKTTRTTLS
jgi:hypothetical protein